VIASSRNLSKAPDAASTITSKSNGKWANGSLSDVTASQRSVNQTIVEAESSFGPIDILINNAGYSVLGAAEEVSKEVARRQYETNHWGPL
jgi:NAD(P)-dependent dehydrogenase (short-subunit alcohol dehydrogenase family)